MTKLGLRSKRARGRPIALAPSRVKTKGNGTLQDPQRGVGLATTKASLDELLDAGKEAAEIAAALNRTRQAVYARLQRVYRKRARLKAKGKSPTATGRAKPAPHRHLYEIHTVLRRRWSLVSCPGKSSLNSRDFGIFSDPLSPPVTVPATKPTAPIGIGPPAAHVPSPVNPRRALAPLRKQYAVADREPT